MRHPDASCILYDDEDCNGEDGIRKMANGESILDVEKMSFKSVCSSEKKQHLFSFFLVYFEVQLFLERLQLYRSSDLAGGGKDWSLKSFITCSCISSDTLLAIIARLPIL